MTKKTSISYFDPINFKQNLIQINKKEEIYDKKIQKLGLLQTKFPEIGKKECSEQLKILESHLINILNDFGIKEKELIQIGQLPIDNRFPVNFKTLGTHCQFQSAILDLLFQSIFDLIVSEIPEKAVQQRIFSGQREYQQSEFFKEKLAKFIKILFPEEINSIITSDENLKQAMNKPLFLKRLGRVMGLINNLDKPKFEDQDGQLERLLTKFLEEIEIKNQIKKIILNLFEWKFTSGKKENDKNIPLFLQLLEITDLITNSNKGEIFDLDFYSIILEKNQELSTIFESNQEKKLKQAIKQHNADKLKEVRVKNRFGDQEQSIPWFLTSEDQVEESRLRKSLAKISAILNTKEIISKKIEKQTILSFFHVEFRSIQHFIFSSNKLKIIKNKSIFIQNLNHIFKDAFAEIMGKQCVVSSGGGSLLALTTKNQKQRIENAIKEKIKESYPDSANYILKNLEFNRNDYSFKIYELLYGSEQMGYDFEQIFDSIKDIKDTKEDLKTTKTKKLDILSYFDIQTSSFAELSDKEKKYEFFLKFQQKKNFGELISLYLGQKSPAELKSYITKTVIPSNQHNLVDCRFCQTYPASGFVKQREIEEDELVSDKGYMVCPLCKTIYESDQQDSVNKHNNPIINLKNNLKKAIEKGNVFQKHIDQKGQKPAEISLPISLDNLTNDELKLKTLPEGSNKIAMIKIDGNNIGFIKTMLGSLASYRNFSNLIDQEIKNLLKKAILDTIQKDIKNTARDIIEKQKENENTIYYIPFEPVIIGGDDITLLCRGDLAFEFVDTFFKKLNDFFGKASLYKFSKNQHHFFKPQDRGKTKEHAYFKIGGQDPKLEEDDKEVSENENIFPKTRVPLGFSGGITFFSPKSPLNRVFNLANNLEDRAKAYIKKRIKNYEQGKAILASNPKRKIERLRALGAWNSIAVYYTSTHELSPSLLNNYYSPQALSSNSKIRYKYSQFPLSTNELKNFRSKIKEMNKKFTSGNQKGKKIISKNKIKTFVRTMRKRTPNENKLQHYYLIGKTEENSPKQQAYEDMLDILMIPLNQRNNKTYKDYFIPLWDIIQYSEFE